MVKLMLAKKKSWKAIILLNLYPLKCGKRVTGNSGARSGFVHYTGSQSSG